MSKLLKSVVLLILGGVGLIGVLICMLFISAYLVEPLIIHKVTPLEYPNSQLVDVENWGGSGGAWEKKTYHTNDDIDKVVDFYEQELPGFEEDVVQNKPSPVYLNWKKYDGWLNKLVISEYYGGVTIHPNPDDKSTTLIETEVGYSGP